MMKYLLFFLALANFMMLVFMIHLKKEDWTRSLAIIEIVLVYFALTLPE